MTIPISKTDSKEIILAPPQSQLQIDEILNQVTSKDLEKMGIKLNELNTLMQSVSFTHAKKSNLPVIGGFVDRFFLRREQFKVQFANATTQITTVVNEIAHMADHIQGRNADLDLSFSDIVAENEQIVITMANIEQAILELDKALATKNALYNTNPTPELAQEISDLGFERASLDKRLSDYTMLKYSNEQILPAIRIVQNNNKLLLDKFQTAKLVTLPAWKNQMLLALSLQEQADHANIATQLDKTTNQLLKDNADLLHQNAVNVSKLSQATTIDPDTLRYTHEKLIATFNDIASTQRAGVAERKKAVEQLKRFADDRHLKQIGHSMSSGASVVDVQTSSDVAQGA